VSVRRSLSGPLRPGTVALVATTALLVSGMGSASAGATTAPVATTVYAAPDGSGSACTRFVPCSIQQAQTSVRDQSPQMRGNIDVDLAGGTYRLVAPMTFGAQDSGQNGYHIVWQPTPGTGTPVISGGTAVTGWTQTSTPGLWSAPVPTGLTATRQLYADGVRIPRSTGTSPVTLTPTATGYTASDATMANWRNPSQIEMVYDGGNGAWTQPRCDVAGISGTTITMDEPCWDNFHLKLSSTTTLNNGNDIDNAWGGFPGDGSGIAPTRIENAFELLTPGHWYLDSAGGKVYYDARSTDDVPSMSFTAADLQQLMTTETTPDTPLTNVTFTGLAFSYATWLQPSSPDGFVEMQANVTLTGSTGGGDGATTTQGLCTFVLPAGSCPFASWTREPAAVDFAGTSHVSFLGDTFTHLGGAGLGLYHGATDDLVQGNEFNDISGNALELGSADDAQPTAFATDLARGAQVTYGSGSEIDGTAYSSYQVDLGAVKPLWSLGIQDRTDLPADYWAFVSSKPFDSSLTPQQQAAQPGVWSSHETNQTGTSASIAADTSGRYVMVEAEAAHVLDPGEARVQVMSGAEILTGNRILDNDIHNAGAEYTAAVGISAFYSRNTTISNNEVHDLPYSGISFGWGGWHTNSAHPDGNPNINQDNTISDNMIYHVMQVRQDGGSIYTNGAQDDIDTGTESQGISHGLKIQGNVSHDTSPSNTYYSDEGSSYTLLAGNVQYSDDGSAFDAGCSTTGHFLIENNYYQGNVDDYFCDFVGSDFVLGSGSNANVRLSPDPAPNEIPASVLAAAGLEAPYTSLTTKSAPVTVHVSPISAGTVLISGSGFTPESTVELGGAAASTVTYLSSNYLVAGFSSSAPPFGDVTVTTGTGTSSAVFTYDPTRDVAKGKAASQSSTYGSNTTAANAVDGNTDGSYFDGSISHTNDDANAWWQVDLGSSQALSGIGIWNRSDCCADRLTDYWVFVSNTPFDTSLTPVQQAATPGVWSSHQTGEAGYPTMVRLPSAATGRYIMIQLSGTNYLALAEVEAWS